MRAVALLLPMLLAACTQAVPMVDEETRPPLPEESYREAAESGAAVYRIAPQESLILVRVGRAGRMKKLGHEHAVASEDVQGFIEVREDRAASRADLVLPIRNLVVDKPDYRMRLGLETGPSADDVAKTYTNMLKVFEPELHPWVKAQVRIAALDSERAEFAVSITLHGVSHEYLLPAKLEMDAERLVVSGNTQVRHSDFGVEPFAAAGGLVRVADEMVIEFRLVGTRAEF